MLKNDDKRVIMDFSPKAACSSAVAMFFESLHIYQDVNYTGFVHDYREKHFYKLYGYVTADEVASSNWSRQQSNSCWGWGELDYINIDSTAYYYDGDVDDSNTNIISDT